MTKIDIFSGFLGAGKTTLIKKLLTEAMDASKVVLIENEFGEIAVDGGFLKDSGVEITEMSQGCICCSLVGDFATSLKEVLDKYHPERILIEPSGVGKLSDVMKAVSGVDEGVALNSAVAVVDANKCKMYAKNFGEFFLNQIENAGTIILSRTAGISEEKLQVALDIIHEHNPKATVITTPWEQLDGKQILATIENAKDLEAELMEEVAHHHHHDDDDEECCCCGHDHHHHHDDDDDDDEHEHDHHHHHDDDDDDDEHEHDHHHHHDDDDDDDEHEHHHHHHHDDDDDDDEECPVCGGHHHHHDHDHDHEHEHHHHHHADEIFTSWGMETAKTYTMDEIKAILSKLDNEEEYGIILRAKGMLPQGDGTWVNFDFVPEESNVRLGVAEVTGKICVIGSKLKEDNLKTLFGK